MDATTELLSDHFVRLRMRRPPHFSWSPGQTAYLILPGVSTLPFEAHPFTIASVHSSLLTEGEISEKALGDSTPYWSELVFLINIREGFTKRLRNAALKNELVKVFVDGPYGPSPDLRKYNTSVLVAGRYSDYCCRPCTDNITIRWYWRIVHITHFPRHSRVSFCLIFVSSDSQQLPGAYAKARATAPKFHLSGPFVTSVSTFHVSQFLLADMNRIFQNTSRGYQTPFSKLHSWPPHP